MNGRFVTLLLTILLPVALLALTILEFGSNPVAIFALLAVMVAGGFYLLSYTEVFA